MSYFINILLMFIFVGSVYTLPFAVRNDWSVSTIICGVGIGLGSGYLFNMVRLDD